MSQPANLPPLFSPVRFGSALASFGGALSFFALWVLAEAFILRAHSLNLPPLPADAFVSLCLGFVFGNLLHWAFTRSVFRSA